MTNAEFVSTITSQLPALVGSLLFFILCIVLVFVLASLKESCYTAEGFFVGVSSNPTIQALIKFYLNSASNPVNTLEVLESEEALNLTAIQAILSSPIVDPNNPFYPRFANASNVLPDCLPSLISLTTQLTAQVVNATRILGNAGLTGSLLYFTSLEVVQVRE